MKTKKKKLIKINEFDIGRQMYTNLRKYGNSSATSIAYFIIMHNDAAWNSYLEDVKFAIKDCKNEVELIKAVKNLDLDWMYISPEYGNYARECFIILKHALKLFDDKAWKAFCAYLIYEDNTK